MLNGELYNAQRLQKFIYLYFLNEELYTQRLQKLIYLYLYDKYSVALSTNTDKLTSVIFV